MHHYSFKATPEEISFLRICNEAPKNVQTLAVTVGKRSFLAFRKDSIVCRAAKTSQLYPYVPTFRAAHDSFELCYGDLVDDWYFVTVPKQIMEMLDRARNLRTIEKSKLLVAVKEITID